MGLLSGSMSLRRYRVLAQPPKDFREVFEKAVRAHALVPLDPERNEEKSVGWASVFDEQDTDLHFSKFFHDGRILLSLRVDTLKPPSNEVKRLLRQRQREVEAQRREPLSASALRELKDMIKLDLRRRTPPRTRTVDMLWDLDGQRLYFLSHAKGPNEAFLRLFAETFNLGLDIEGPGLWAHGIGEADGLAKELTKARPTSELLGGFWGLRPCPRLAENVAYAAWGDSIAEAEEAGEPSPLKDALEDRRFLAREFLTWLIYKSDDENSGGVFPASGYCDAFRVLVGERVQLKALGEGVSEIAARGVAPAQTADVRFSIAGGLTVRESALIFERGDRLWRAAVSAEGFDLRQVKLPALLSEEDSERLAERIELIGELDTALKAAFASFLRLRLSPAWQGEELPRLRAWLAQSIAPDKTDSGPLFAEKAA